MDIETTIGHIAHIDSLLDSRRVSAALDALANLKPSEPMQSWRFTSELTRLREDYALMSRYALDGAADPAREQLYDDIAESVRSLSRLALRSLRMKDDASLYYSTARYEALQRNDSIASLLERTETLSGLMSLAVIDGSGAEVTDPTSGHPARLVMEDTVRRIFNRVWTTHPFTSDDEEAIGSALRSEAMPRHVKHLLVSALMAGELEFHDERRLTLLADTYGENGYGDEELSLKALTALLIGLWVHRDRHMRRRCRAHFEAITESRSWDRDVKTVYFELARARDTERINRKIKDELIPGLMKLRPDIEKRFGPGSVSPESISPEDNPEWQEILDKSGISDKLKELSEIQQDGGDIMMATFNNLKSFSFFNDASNWFLPFYTDHSLVAMEKEEGFGAMAEIVGQAPVLCDSDKFSLICALKHMPSHARGMFLSQFNAQAADMNAAFKSQADTTTARRTGFIARYVQSLYRFFKLFRRKSEFLDFFATPVNLASLDLFAGPLGDVETVTLMAEFYFKRGYYDEAFELFGKLTDMAPATPQTFQKMGYCRQQTSDIEGALDYYSRSELLKSDSLWTLRRLAACHRMLGHHREALDYFNRIGEMRPDDATVALNIGHCLLELGQPDEALKSYYKAEFLNPDSSKTGRPIAWASLLAGDTARARRYYEKIMADGPRAEDCLNAGHLEMIEGHYHDAIANYRRAVALMDFDTSRFSKAFGDDIAVLRRAGVDDFMTGLVFDNVLSSSAADGTPLRQL